MPPSFACRGGARRRVAGGGEGAGGMRGETQHPHGGAGVVATAGQRAEAYDLLAPIYGWFTEGCDTADLQEAKALLAELES